ncbi:MAG: hypothetical protein JXQ99_25005 [Hyphomicrobiaceae bacterium]
MPVEPAETSGAFIALILSFESSIYSRIGTGLPEEDTALQQAMYCRARSVIAAQAPFCLEEFGHLL